jgi:KDO2-lipid IV(A) lauroyltransferase
MVRAEAPGMALRDARDRRSGGVWTRRQTAKNWLIACAVRLAFAGADRVPRGLLLSLGRALGRAVRAFSPRMRRLAVENASSILPRAAAVAVAPSSFERAGENLATCALLRRKSMRALDWVAVPQGAHETLVRALGEGRGAVFVSAHLGPFELLAAAISELGFMPAIVVRESYDARLDAWIDAHRRARGIQVIHRGAPGAAMRIVRALRAGRPVGFLPDLGGRVRTIPAEFLGRRLGFPVGPQQIAKRLGSPIVVGALRPLGKGPIPTFRKFALSIERVESAGDLSAVTQRVARALECAILGAPEDFLWMASPSASHGARSIAASEEEGLDLSTICQSEGAEKWHEGSTASRA